jgi:glycosyltransferase involved in cell wall biosynthesis
MRYYGVPAADISQGLYTADTAIFRCARPLESRPLRFMFVGQFIERKNILRLCDAFLRFRQSLTGSCDLHLYGEGPLRDRIPRHPDIHVHPFASPSILAAAMNESRCLLLPSVIDHWGLVAHEAAACGMLLIASKTTGAAEDLCGAENSRLVSAFDTADLVAAFTWAAKMLPSDLAAASRCSVELAGSFSTATWAGTFGRICRLLMPNGDQA